MKQKGFFPFINPQKSEYLFPFWCSTATREPYLLRHRVLEPDPEFSARRGREEGLPPLHGPPVALREGDVQLSHGELGDDLTQRLGEQPVVGHCEATQDCGEQV